MCVRCQTLNPDDYSFCINCGQALSGSAPAVLQETLFTLANGRYQTVRLLGEGAKKLVYLARDQELDRDVAVGMIKTDLIDADGLARFWREAKAMGRLGDHPNLVTMYDVGEEDSTPYIVSQYLPGGSLDELIARQPQHRLDIPRALDIATQIARALGHAHARGIIHRDVKPGNVWLTDEGVCKLGDFGLAVVGDHTRLTAEGLMVGTANYMAPEQAVGRDVDARSDLYALGAVLYELVCGRTPFLGDDPVAVVFQHINTAPVAPSWHNPQVPHGLEALITALLAKPPDDRPGSADEVESALRALANLSVSSDRAAVVHANPLDRLAAGVFVGRDKELEHLRGALDATFSGSGRLVLLSGEPGIGKTRTAEELMTYARLRDAKVLLGRCYEGEGAPAYWPWMQAIRSYVHDVDSNTLAAEMGSGAAHIAQVVSDVRQRLPDVPEAPALEPEQARFQLFDSITGFLKNASSATPIVLVLDDLHWADTSSLLLLEFVARELRDMRVLVIGTYREEELGRQHPLSQALGNLSRARLSDRVVLRGLTQDEVGHFIELSAGISPSTDLLADVYAQTEGNPFFVGEIVRLLVAEGRLEQRVRPDRSWSVPQSIREVIGRRLDRLSPRCNSLLSLAAVIGRDFDLKVLQQATDEHDVLDVLEEALDARIVAEVGGTIGRYRFSHALIKDTLYEELRTARRIAAHHKVGQALEMLYEKDVDAHAAELAHHFLEAASQG
ncbi:MAG: protein kinase, partial [Actinomycetota bacterium]|nr:protein kinase [Actinomycetota bacterium]